MEGLSIAASQDLRAIPDDPLRALDVDKRIDAKLPKADLGVGARSRKTSHYLGLFKDDDDPAKGEAKSTGGSSESELAVPVLEKAPIRTIDEVPTGPAPRQAGKPPTTSRPSTKSPPSDLAHRGRSATASAVDPPDATKLAADATLATDDASVEQIASALYYPHKGPEHDTQRPSQSRDRSNRDARATESAARTETDDNVEIALVSRDHSHVLQGNLPRSRTRPDEADKEPSRSVSTHPDPDQSSEHDSTFSADEASATTTLTVQTNAAPLVRKSTRQQLATDAVKLKPFNHQVGGHNTVYSFSRQAVCKKLNSRENEFYETVERNHPDLLAFLPRYIGVLNVTYNKPGSTLR